MSGLYDYSGTSEPWCPVPYDYDKEDVECPDCSWPVKLGELECRNCGLTLAEVAERLAR